jgi:hypothetical protein
MPTLLATPEKVAIYTGGDDGPFNEPLRHLGRLKFHSQLAYLPFLPARTITATISVPAGGVGLRRTIDLGAHGQPGSAVYLWYGSWCAYGWFGSNLQLTKHVQHNRLDPLREWHERIYPRDSKHGFDVRRCPHDTAHCYRLCVV